MNYEVVAEEIYNEVRVPGSTFWLELDAAERQRWAYIARAAERFLDPPGDYWCPDCEELESKVGNLEDDLADANDWIDALESKLEKAEEKLNG